MDKATKEILWNQFGASIDMLINAISNCPDDYFITNRRFYYIAFHSTIFLDYYSTIPPKDFSPLLSFTQKETAERPKEAIDDLIPDKIYSKQQIVGYLKQIREKCKHIIYALTDEKLIERFKEGNEPNDMDYPILEILLYNLRHTLRWSNKSGHKSDINLCNHGEEKTTSQIRQPVQRRSLTAIGQWARRPRCCPGFGDQRSAIVSMATPFQGIS
jgi:hypothetical protein